MRGRQTHFYALKEDFIENIKELEEKLRKLRQFDAKSPNIFKEVESFQKTVQQGICKGTMYDSTILRCDKHGWVTTLLKIIEANYISTSFVIGFNHCQ